MTTVNKNGGGVLVLIFLMVTFLFLYIRYQSYQKLPIQCFDEDKLIVLNDSVSIPSFENEVCLKLLDTNFYKFEDGHFQKFLHSDANFVDYFVKNQAKLVLIKVE